MSGLCPEGSGFERKARADPPKALAERASCLTGLARETQQVQQLERVARQLPKEPTERDSSIAAQRSQSTTGERALCRIHNHPRDHERHAITRSKRRGETRFHIDRDCAGPGKEICLGRWVAHGFPTPCEPSTVGCAKPEREPVRPRGIARIPAVGQDHIIGHDPGSRPQFRIQTARQAETDNACRAGAQGPLELSRENRRVQAEQRLEPVLGE